jgi:uncharacterized protein YbjT (DUF2867 family)
MALKVIITGSTGMIGKGCLLECIDSFDVKSILLLNRNPSGINDPKVKEVIVKDFFDVKSYSNSLAGYDACFYCLGITSAGMKEVDYSRITHDMTILFAKELLALNPGITFCYISGAGTDSSEKGRSMWARVKGRTENALLSMGFKHAYMFRPGFIQPKRGIRSRTGWYNAVYKIMGPFYFLLKRMPAFVTDTERLAKAMIHVALNGYAKKILESSDINNIDQ